MTRALCTFTKNRTGPTFFGSKDEVTLLVDKVRIAQGKLYGRLFGQGFEKQFAKVADNLSADIVRSSEIEGIELNIDEVRSSVATRLGLENDSGIAFSHGVKAVVEVMLSAMEHYNEPITDKILFGWQAAFFQDLCQKGLLACDDKTAKRRTYHLVEM